MALLQQLTPEQSQVANFIEREKQNLKEEGVVLKKRIKEAIICSVINLLVFLACHYYHFQIIVMDGETSHTRAFRVASACWVAISCLVTYFMVGPDIEAIDKLLQRDEVLNRNVVVFCRNVRDSIEIHRVTGELIEGRAEELEVRIPPHIVDHGVRVSKLAELKKLVEEPLVVFSYRFIYRLLLFTLFSFGILLLVGFPVISDYAMKGDEYLNNEYLNFGLLSPN